MVLSAVLFAAVVLPGPGAGPGIREGYGYRFVLDLMRALMRIPPGVKSDVLEKDPASGVNGLYGSAFFGRFGDGVLGAMVWCKKRIVDKRLSGTNAHRKFAEREYDIF